MSNQQVDWATDVAFDSDVYLYVSDRNNNNNEILFILKGAGREISVYVIGR